MFAWMHLCVPHVYLIPKEAKLGVGASDSLEVDLSVFVSHHEWMHWDPLQEQQVLLTHKPSLQPQGFQIYHLIFVG